MASDPVNVSEFEKLARHALPKMYYDYFRGGAEDQYTLKENICAFQRIMLRPRVLVDVSKIDMSTTLLGYKMPAPIIIAPTGYHQLAHPKGEVATARAAATCNTIMVLSFSSSYKIEDVASSCNAVRFYQLYVFKRRDVAVKLVQKAESWGFKALVLTVDTPRLGRREADKKNKMIAPKKSNLEGLLSVEFDSKGGSNLEAFASETLDASLSWKVVTAISGAVPVLLDGGVRRGTDVYKALALGAKAVMIGRPVIYGLAAKGESGVKTVIEMLQNELELTMALTGCPSIKDITRNHVRTKHAFSLKSMI